MGIDLIHLHSFPKYDTVYGQYDIYVNGNTFQSLKIGFLETILLPKMGRSPIRIA